MNEILSTIAGVLLSIGAFLGFNQEPAVGGFSDPFISIQLAASPSNGLVLKTDGTNNYWDTDNTGGSGGGSFPFTATTNYGVQVYATNTPSIWLQGGVYASSTSHLVNASSTQQTIFGTLWLPSITSKGLAVDSAGKVYGAATTTYNSPLSYANGSVTLSTSGAWSGTAGSLAANGANCSSGSAPLGVDASGASESCFDVWTEAENTAAAYVNAAGTMTGTYDGNNFAGGAIGAGDLLYGASAGSITELSIGASSTALTTDGSTPKWQKLSINDLNSFGTTTLAGGISGTRADFTSTSTFDGIFVETGGIRNKMLPSCDSVDTNASGDFVCGSDATAAGAANPFTWSSTFNTLSAATTSALWLTSGSLFASSTAFFHSSITIGNNATASNFTSTSTTLVNTFPNASTTDFTIANVVKVPYETIGFTYATSTAWSGTTTIFLGPAKGDQTFVDIACETNVGTLGISLYDGTNRVTPYIPTASTTINTNLLTTTNVFTKNESRRVDIGTPASSPTKVACTAKFTYTNDN